MKKLNENKYISTDQPSLGGSGQNLGRKEIWGISHVAAPEAHIGGGGGRHFSF